MNNIKVENRLNLLYNFSGLEDYRRFIANENKILNKHNKELFDEMFSDNVIENRIKNKPNWFGAGVTLQDLKNGLNKFSNPELIELVYNKIKNKIPQNISGKLKERKMDFNEIAGSFSISRFMMSMYKRPAYFSIKKQSYVSLSEVYEKDNSFFLKSDNTEVEKKEMVVTNNKKLFAYFKPIEKESQAIEIVIVAGANADKSSEKMLYTGIAGILIAEMCEKSGIKVRINSFVGSTNDDKITGAIIPIKEFGQTIDRNVMALLTSDARVFRYEMFNGIITNYNNFNKNCPESLGSLTTLYELENSLNKEVIKEVFGNRKVFITSGIFSESDAIEKIDKILSDISAKNN